MLQMAVGPSELMATYPTYQKVVDKSFLQSVISNHPELLRSKGVVVNVRGKGAQKDVR